MGIPTAPPLVVVGVGVMVTPLLRGVGGVRVSTGTARVRCLLPSTPALLCVGEVRTGTGRMLCLLSSTPALVLLCVCAATAIAVRDRCVLCARVVGDVDPSRTSSSTVPVLVCVCAAGGGVVVDRVTVTERG